MVPGQLVARLVPGATDLAEELCDIAGHDAGVL